MAKKHVRILSAVNASAVSKSGGMYTITGVCGAVNDIVMNGMLYPAEQLAKGVATLNSKPAPAGHPKNASGQFISASSGEALLNAYIGSVCTNARHEGGRTLVDILVNEAQAKAHPQGAKLIERLDAAIANTNAEPIHVSTGLMVEAIAANGESLGKKYSRIATNLNYDHLAILLNETGAGTPEQGVGMFLNSEGAEEEVESVTVNADPVDRRAEGALSAAKALIRRLLGNADVSFDQIYDGLRAALPDDHAWIREVFDRYAVWSDREGKLFKQDYSVSSDGSVAFSGDAVEVARKVSYAPISTNREEDPVNALILAALNSAGIKTDGLSDDQLLAAYNSVVRKPVEDKLVAANSKLAELELAANAAKDAEATAIATELAVNSSLTVDDFKALGLDRLKALQGTAAANKTAAPVTPAANQSAGDEFAGYDLNKLED